MIDLNLLKQVTDFADWFLSLPAKLVEAVLQPRQVYLENNEKTAKLEELAALREAGEHVQYIYLFKGNVYVWANRLQAQQQVEEVAYVREMFREAASQLGEVQKILSETSLSSLVLISEAAVRIGEAKRTYENLAALSDADILDDRGLIDIIAALDSLSDSGGFLMRLADHHREELEKG